jgi:hypothetical protein
MMIINNSLQHIDYINIDAEGFDWYVIDGMERSLRLGMIDMFSFEAGESIGRNIEATMNTLSSYGYDSYMMIHQRLIKLSGAGCWSSQWNMDKPIGNTGHAKPNILVVRRAWSLRHAILAPFMDTRAHTLLTGTATITAAAITSSNSNNDQHIPNNNNKNPATATPTATPVAVAPSPTIPIPTPVARVRRRLPIPSSTPIVAENNNTN